MYFNKEIETMPLNKMRELQLERLKWAISHAYNNNAFYRKKYDDAGFHPDQFKSLDDMKRVPFLTKQDMRNNYPFGLFAVPMEKVVRVHSSSGTTGNATVVGYTKKDVGIFAEVVARCLAAYGATEKDVLQVAYGYGLFTGGLGLHYGGELLGALTVPISGGNTDRQIMLMRDFGVTAIACTPSYFLHLIEAARQQGVDLKKLPLKAGVFGAEPWTDAMRARIEAEAAIEAFDIYGLTEVCGPGVGIDCRHHCGLHILEDHFYPEVIDTETGEPVPDGTEGELVLTTLSKWAMPMIRYRTRDITTLLPGTCACGRTLRRMRRIGRRSDDMLIIRGVNVYPSQIESVLLEVEGTLPHYQIILTRERGLDQIEVQVEVTAQIFSDRVGALEVLADKLMDSIERVVGIRIKVTLVEPQTIQRSEGKAKRIIDKRGQS